MVNDFAVRKALKHCELLDLQSRVLERCYKTKTKQQRQLQSFHKRAEMWKPRRTSALS